jgi:hypothetical protein
MRRVFLIFCTASLLAGCSVVGIRSGYEQPSYVIIDKLKTHIQIREIPPKIVVGTTVDIADYNEGRRVAFRRLFDYISGANISKTSLDMTVPIESTGISEKISMTAPVESVRNSKGHMEMRFFLPKYLSLEKAPRPTNSEVYLLKQPAELQAVLRFNGSTNEHIVTLRGKELLQELESSSWDVISKPTTYSYDPPWTLPIFRRNEVVVTVMPKTN